MNRLFEAESDEARLRDGGFIFQAILSYDLMWAIVDGETVFDQGDVSARLHQVDAFPDMKFQEGYATLTYVILSEVNLLKRKIDLANEEIKKRINPNYAAAFDAILGGEDPFKEESEDEVSPEDPTKVKGQLEAPKPVAGSLGQGQAGLAKGQNTLEKGQGQLNKGQGQLNKGQAQLPEPIGESIQVPHLTAAQIKELNDRYFKGTRYNVRFTTKNTVLREVSTSGLDSGRPSVTLKLSTGMVNTLDGKEINSWEGFKVNVSGGLTENFVIDETGEPPISKIIVYDPIENVNEPIFRTILPSLLLEFSGDSVQIETYSNRSSQVAIKSVINFDSLFEPDMGKKADIEEPEEGEEEEESKKPDSSEINN
jgi:hypothetical protein